MAKKKTTDGLPWERQPDETEKAYEAFMIYRDKGPGRNLSEVARELQKSRQLIERWKTTHKWLERVRLFDAEMERQTHEKSIKDYRAMTSRHTDIAMQLQKKALQALQKLNVEDMSPKDIKEYIKMATELERLNRTIEKQTGTVEDVAPASLADTIIAAYKRRKEGEG